MSRRADVFVVTWERCLGSENGETCGVFGVFHTAAGAYAAAQLDAKDWNLAGKRVIFDSVDGAEMYGQPDTNAEEEWDICIKVRQLPLEG